MAGLSDASDLQSRKCGLLKSVCGDPSFSGERTTAKPSKRSPNI
jgi:hypothetical protein